MSSPFPSRRGYTDADGLARRWCEAGGYAALGALPSCRRGARRVGVETHSESLSLYSSLAGDAKAQGPCVCVRARVCVAPMITARSWKEWVPLLPVPIDGFKSISCRFRILFRRSL